MPIRIGHVHRPGFEPARHQLDFAALVIQAIERIEEALARNLEHMVDALGNESVRQYSPAMTRADATLAGLSQFHSDSPLCQRRVRISRGATEDKAPAVARHARRARFDQATMSICHDLITINTDCCLEAAQVSARTLPNGAYDAARPGLAGD